MEFVVKIITLAVVALLTTAILLQQRGSGLGSAFGTDANVYATKRGIEKALFIATIVLGTAFLGLALFTLFAS